MLQRKSIGIGKYFRGLSMMKVLSIRYYFVFYSNSIFETFLNDFFVRFRSGGRSPPRAGRWSKMRENVASICDKTIEARGSAGGTGNRRIATRDESRGGLSRSA